MNAQIERVIGDLGAYERNLHKHRTDIPYEIKTSIISQIVRTGSIDTSRFIQAVDFREEGYGEGYRFLIDASRDSEVTYDGFLEFDGVTRRFVGRYNYRDGIQQSRLKPIFDEIASESFAR